MCEPYGGGPARPVRLILSGREVACKAIIFDKDGTLVDPTGLQSRLTRIRALYAAAEATAGRLQGASSSRACRKAQERPSQPVGSGERRPARDAARMPEAQVDAAPAAAPDVADLDEGPYGPGLLPGVDHMLATFRNLGLRIAIATGDRRKRAQATMDALGVGGHFAAIVGIDDVASGKPAPDMVHAACERLGCSPAEVIVVGDSPADLMMGRAAGVAACIAVTGGGSASERLGALADAVVPTAAALQDLLARRE